MFPHRAAIIPSLSVSLKDHPAFSTDQLRGPKKLFILVPRFDFPTGNLKKF